ncbi:sigma 54-interacting transcriptional regulator [Mariniflexile litorale]|uniref:Sigma 54-interacting transcriptional regulator n=1 Tax=Mariniflexile litorale TaxID=3045158 RepID=A0AAU7ELB0_9FLAO|nr:sigma 54-interacting transcriptional regulator [Mariniflexile sp. KMM 9835]MDQ8212780.1 sigma 54-interacting transcriptional regulator [Mariniflexile sp. KMM 9835]
MKTSRVVNKDSKIEKMNFFISLFQNSPIPKTISNISTKKYVFVNPAWEKFTGFTKKEAIGKTALDLEFSGSEDLALIRGKLLKEKEVISYECSVKLKSGIENKVLRSFYIIAVKDEEFVLNTINNFEGLDIYKEEQELIKRTEELLVAQDSIESMTDGFMTLNNEWIYTYVNKKAAIMLGKKPEDLIGKHIWTEFPEVVGLPFYSNYNKAFETQQIITFEDYYHPWDRWFENRVIPSKDGISVSFQDITDRKKAEELLIKSERYLDRIINNIGDPLFVKDSESRLLLVNNVFCSIFNLSREDIIGKTLAEDVSADERENFLKIDKQVLLTGVENINEEYLTVRGEKTRIISTKKTRFVDDNGNKFLIGVIRDVTERKQAEIDLKLSKEFTDKLIMSMQEGLIIVNLEGEIIMVNDSTCNILQYSKEELLGMEFPYPFINVEDFKGFGNISKKIVRGEKPSFQFEFIKKSGEKFSASFLTGNIKNDKEDVIALFGTMKDISEELKVQHTLEDIAKKSTQKKAVILELAGLVGSDFETALGKITSLSAETLNIERVSVWKYNTDKSELICQKEYNLKDQSYSNRSILREKDNSDYFKALSRKETICVFDAVKNKITKGFAEDYLIPNGVTSMMDVFIQGATGNYGVLCFEHVGPKRKWTADEEEFAISIANLVSLMVESKERNLAEIKLIESNEKLLLVNTELNKLKKELEQENVYLREEIDLVFNYEEMVYSSAAFSNVLTDVERVAATKATVLLLGESGTGKELLARAIHNISPRKNKPLIKVNCAAIPKELIESELFGHKKGSFTGAVNDKLGKFKLADGGTLFLDEIGELPLDMQPKLLRAIQESEIEQVGGIETHKIDIRIIAATNKDLKKEILNKNFREDLYFRINVFPIVVPPLRERVEDIPILIEHFVDKFSKVYNKNIKYISEEAKQSMQAYKWPGNIRELENLIERAVILSDSETLILSSIETSSVSKELPISMSSLTLNEVQRNHIIKTLERCNWKIDGANGASKLLDIKPSTLRDRMKKLGIKKSS